MSDFEELKDDRAADPGDREGEQLEATPSFGAESAAVTPVNPRKRKKSSRACDFCHVNHQPCDNAKPRCSYCERHNKSCLYLRPQKKRGPAQGYRSALHTLRESAAAWGAALNLIPSLGPVVEGYLKQPEGKRLIKAIKDPAQQEFFIQAWQQSGVFKTFFGDETSGDNTTPAPDDASTTATIAPQQPSDCPQPDQTNASSSSMSFANMVVSMPNMPNLPKLPPLAPMSLPANMVIPTPKFDNDALAYAPTSSPPHDGNKPRRPSVTSRSKPRQDSMSLSDIMAKDAARSSLGFSQTLGSLGFAPNETLEDFLDMSFNPEPIEQPVDPDPGLGSEQDQQAYYELLMGRRFG